VSGEGGKRRGREDAKDAEKTGEDWRIGTGIFGRIREGLGQAFFAETRIRTGIFREDGLETGPPWARNKGEVDAINRRERDTPLEDCKGANVGMKLARRAGFNT
jgi:hypothetical protein